MTARLKQLHLLAHELTGKVINGLSSGYIVWYSKVHVINIMTDKFLVFRYICSKKEKVLAPYQLDNALYNGYYKLPEDDGAALLGESETVPKAICKLIGTEM